MGHGPGPAMRSRASRCFYGGLRFQIVVCRLAGFAGGASLSLEC